MIIIPQQYYNNNKIMYNLKYNQTMTQQQIIKIYQQRIKQQNLFKSQFYLSSYIYYPYHFQSILRYHYIQQQQSILKSLQLSSLTNRFLIVRKVINFNQPLLQNVQKTWVVNINTLQVIKIIHGNINKNQLYQLQKSSTLSHLPKLPTKFQNILFFGRTNFQGRSIYIQNDTHVSNKHMFLVKQANTDQSIIMFLLCLKKISQNKSYTKLSKLLTNLPTYTIKKILTYLGKLNKHTYSLVDNSSNNGTYFYPYGQLSLNTQLKQHLVISKQQGFIIKLKTIVKKTKLSNLTLNIDNIITESMRRNVHILNRNLQLQTTTTTPLSVLILTVKTPRTTKLHILYSTQSPYSIIKNDQDLKIIINPPSTSGINYGQIKWEQNGWILASKHIFFQFQNHVHYTIKKEAYIRLGSTTNLIITLNTSTIQ